MCSIDLSYRCLVWLWLHYNTKSNGFIFCLGGGQSVYAKCSPTCFYMVLAFIIMHTYCQAMSETGSERVNEIMHFPGRSSSLVL